jgi:hypothetical protein
MLENLVIAALNPANAVYTLTAQILIIGALIAFCARLERRASGL